MHRQPELVQWLVHNVPQLVSTEATGKIFGSTKSCYFGGTPLLFALASNQIDMAKHVLKGAGRQQDTKKNDGESLASIFTCDRHGNNVSHLAVIRDLPDVYDFALRYVIRLLSTVDLPVLNSKSDQSVSDERPSDDVHAVESMVDAKGPTLPLSRTEESNGSLDTASSASYRHGVLNLVAAQFRRVGTAFTCSHHRPAAHVPTPLSPLVIRVVALRADYGFSRAPVRFGATGIVFRPRTRKLSVDPRLDCVATVSTDS